MPNLKGSLAEAICVYVLRTINSRASTYVGYTVCLKRRLRAHSGLTSAGAKATRGRDWEPYLAITGFVSKAEAMSLEWHLKYQTKPRNKNAVPIMFPYYTGRSGGHDDDREGTDDDAVETTAVKDKKRTKQKTKMARLSPCQRRVASLWRLLADKDRSWNQCLDPISKLERGLEHGDDQEEEGKNEQHSNVKGDNVDEEEEEEEEGSANVREKMNQNTTSAVDTPFKHTLVNRGTILDKFNNNSIGSNDKQDEGLNIYPNSVAQGMLRAHNSHPAHSSQAVANTTSQRYSAKADIDSQGYDPHYSHPRPTDHPLAAFIESERRHFCHIQTNASPRNSPTNSVSRAIERHWIIHWSKQAQQDLPRGLVHSFLDTPTITPRQPTPQNQYWGVPERTIVHHVHLNLDNMCMGLDQLSYLPDVAPKPVPSSRRRKSTAGILTQESGRKCGQAGIPNK